MRRGALALLALTGCDVAYEGKDSGDTGPVVVDHGTTGTPGTVPTDGTWTVHTGPCSGYRTETLVYDADGSAWAGCGADTGLFFAAGPGAWESVPAHATFHCYDAQIAGDGLLYVAGDDTDSDDVAYRGDPAAGAGFTGAVIVSYDHTVDGITLAGGIQRSDDGTIVVDSENGNAWTLSTDDGKSFTSQYFSGYQWLDTDLAPNGRIYAAGSTIAQPPSVFLPAADPADYAALELPGGFTGELFGLAALGADHLIAVGVDEPTHHGILATCASGCDAAGGWDVADLTASADLGKPADAGRLHAVAFDAAGTFGMAVGEKNPQAQGGWAMYTTDGGSTWKLAPNPGFPILTAVFSFGDGSFAVAGGDSYLAISTPLP